MNLSCDLWILWRSKREWLPSGVVTCMSDETSSINGETCPDFYEHSRPVKLNIQTSSKYDRGQKTSYLSCGDPLRAGWSGLGFCGGWGFCCKGGRVPPGPPWPCEVGRGCWVVGGRGPPCCGAVCGASWVGCGPPWVGCLVGWPCLGCCGLCWGWPAGLGPWPPVWGLCGCCWGPPCWGLCDWGEPPELRWAGPCAGLCWPAVPWLACRCGGWLGRVCWAGGFWALGLVTDWVWAGGWPWGEGRCCGGAPWRAGVALTAACCGPPKNRAHFYRVNMVGISTLFCHTEISIHFL